MERKVAAFINKGMSRDLAISKASNEFAFDNQNIRITPDKESTLLSVSNEKGTYKVPNITINGTVIGYCLCNDKILLFSTFRKLEGDVPEFPDDGKEYSADYLTLIYNKLEKSGYRLVGEILYEGDLGLSMDRPVETLFNYETETVQKVYWIDGVHQVRFININADAETIESWKEQSTPFDFLKELKLEETVTIEKTDFYANFPSGVLQYFITYSNYFGQETPVVWQSNLIYLTEKDRGLSKEEFSTNAIMLNLSNLDTSWDRLNIYSIIRTEYNAVPQGRRMSYDITGTSMSILDDNLLYSSEDVSSILFKGGELIIPQTMTSKDNVLFVGNNKVEYIRLDDAIKGRVSEIDLKQTNIEIDTEDFLNQYYKYDNSDFTRNTINDSGSLIFYPNENYHIAVQFQNKLGLWTEPLYLGSDSIKKYPEYNSETGKYEYKSLSVGVTDSLSQLLYTLGYRKMRALVSPHNTTAVQGLVFPTVFKAGSRYDRSVFAQTSWFARPYISVGLDSNIPTDLTKGVDLEFRHSASIPEYGKALLRYTSTGRYSINSSNYRTILRAEIQSNYGSPGSISPLIYRPIAKEKEEFVNNHYNSFFIDSNIVDVFSPDIDSDSDLSGYKFRIIGLAEKYANTGYKNISASNVITDDSGANQYPVLVNREETVEYSHPWNAVSSGLFWKSKPFRVNGNDYKRSTDIESLRYVIFPWHKTGSIVNDPDGQADILVYNRTSNLHYCSISHYVKLNDVWNPPQGESVTLFKETENLPVIIEGDEVDTRILYKGNVDEVLTPRVLSEGEGDQYTGADAAVYPILAAHQQYGQTSPNSIAPANLMANGQFPTSVNLESMWNPLNSAIQGVRMKYKSTPHAVVKFKNTQGETYLLPYLNSASKGSIIKGDRFEFWRDYQRNEGNRPLTYLDVNIIDSVEWVLCSPRARQFYADSDRGGSSIDDADVRQVIAIHNSVLNPNSLRENKAIGPEYHNKLVFIANVSEIDWDETVQMQVYLYNNIFYMDVNHIPITKARPAFVSGILLRLVPMDAPWAYTNGRPHIHSSLREDYYLYEVLSVRGTSGISNYIRDVNNDVYYYLQARDKFYYQEELWGAGADEYIYRVTYDYTDRNYNYINNNYVQRQLSIGDQSLSGFFIGELYKDSVDTFDQYNAQFMPCSEAVPVMEKRVTCSGDCWFTRYDMLRVYAASDTDENSVIDIVSAWLISRRNLNARYDRNRGLLDNTIVSPSNFNLFNNVYDQKDNFYTTQILNPKLFNNTDFKTSIIWSLPKSPGAEIDNWTHLYSSSILYLDGDKGELRSLNRLGNSIISFQDKGIAEIMYNFYAQLQATQGLPIELANSGKVDGKRYLYNNTGCVNKWSIVERDNSLYFIDDISGSINALTPQLVSLSDTKGFKTWINQTASLNIWNPLDYKNVRGFYDKSLNDVYWSSGDYCLVYSELLGQFMSFMPYRKTSMIENFNGHLVTERNGSLWYMQEGDYNNFYGNYEDYSMQYRVTPDPYGDKIFTNIEYRSDMFEGDTEVPFDTFDTLTAETEYQHGQIRIVGSTLQPSSAKKKFRIWRVNIPRDTKDKTANPYGLNRMRNPWISLRLTKDNSDGNHLRNIFHDLVVYYYE